MDGMIDLYTAPTPNGWKISIMLEECGLPYRAHWLDLFQGDQFRQEFVRIGPNGKIPAIIDNKPEGGGEAISVFETGAILIYLAQKTGRFLPRALREQTAVLEWLFWQVGGLGPILGQHGHFKLYAPDRIAYATDRYRRETLRLYGVLDARLSAHQHVAGELYSIADMACFPWVQTYRAQEVPLDEFPAVRRWYESLKQRPALRRGMDLGRTRLVRRGQGDNAGSQGGAEGKR